MNTKAVKSFGLALLLAAGVLAVMLALGTFSIPKVGAQEADLVETGSISVTPNTPGPGAAGIFTVTFRAASEIADFERLAVKLNGFGVPSSIEKAAVQIRLFNTDPDKAGDPTSTGFADDVSVSGNVITLEIYDDSVQTTVGDIEIPTDTWVDLVFRQRAGLTAPAEAGTYGVSVGEETNHEAVKVSPSLSVKPGKGGGGTEVTVSGKAFANGTASLYTEYLSTPDTNNDGIVDAIAYIGTITDTDGDGIPDDNPANNDNNEWGIDVDGDGEADYQIFSSDDGTSDADTTYVAFALLDADDAAVSDNTVEANSRTLDYTISGSPYDATGDTPAGSAPTNPSIPDANYTMTESLKDVTVSDGAFSTTVSAGDLVFSGPQNRSQIRIKDADGFGARARFQVTGTMTLGSESVGKGRLLTISLADWITDLPDEVKIGGTSVAMAVDDADTDDVNESTWYDGSGKKMATAPTDAMLTAPPAGALTFHVKVSGDVGLGTKSVVLFADEKAVTGARASVEITAVDLIVSPSNAVVGREVTVTGSGFTGTVKKVEVGDVPVCEGDGTDACDIEVASGGRVVAAFNIPDNKALAKAGDYSIIVTDSGGRIGAGVVTIPERTLTVDPTESRIGSTINLSGTNWPTGSPANLVSLYYDGTQYASANAGSDGSWSASIGVPHAAGVGTSHKVEARATVGGDRDNVKKDASHKTPNAVVTLSSPQAQRGSTVTVSGENFHTFQTVMIDLAGSNVTPSGLTTDANGSFSGSVLVPGLSLGNKNLKVTVNDVPVVEFLEIIAAAPAPTEPESRAPSDVFADLGDNLVRAWHLDNASGTWSFYDPARSGVSTLSEVPSPAAVWVNVNEATTFQGLALKAGWSLIVVL